ncbi:MULTISPECIES: DUF637 domain-containing protein [Xenorhabdus]|uniref:DUF637 domain-containing protein n=1 Tax=Xenorhabdus TaxID=626 RepID=UPI00068B6BAC|nr:DUF637 domain-containing protein [Xenorhabdus sp. NBAII XenSa04]
MDAGKNVIFSAGNTITTEGSKISSGQNINISSGNDIKFKSSRNYFYDFPKRQERVTRNVTELTSGGSLNIHSEGSILFEATKLVAKGLGATINIAAKGGYLYAAASDEIKNFETINEVKYGSNNKVSEFIASGDINILSRDDSTYEASKIQAGKNITLTSTHGSVNFKAAKNIEYERKFSTSEGFFIKTKDKGHSSEKWILPQLGWNGNFIVDAASGINADIKVKNGQTLQNAINLLGNNPETSWIKDINKRNDVQWTKVKDAYDSWDKSKKSLHPMAGAVIAVVVTAVTAGYAAPAAGAVAGGSAVAQGAVTAGMAALASKAAVSLVENEGNLSKAFKEMGDSDAVKSIITSMVIGGALSGFDAAMGWSSAKDGANAAVSSTNSNLPLLSKGDWITTAQRVAGQSLISSSLNTAINGGSFKDNFATALLANAGNQINAEGANVIGDYGKVLGIPGKAISHAAISALAAHIGGGDARGAAAGALAAELGKMALYNTFDDPAQILAGGKIIGGIAGAFATNSAEGVNSGANASEIVLEYNFFQHELIELNKKITAAKKKGEDIAPIIAEERNKLAAERESLKNECQANPTLCAHNLRYYANDALEPADSFIGRLYFEPEVIAFTFDESAKDHTVIDKYTNGLGQALEYGLVAAKSLGGEDTRFSITGKSIRTGIHNSQARSPSSKPEVIVINTESGKKGAWEEQLNKPKPNKIYHVDGNKTYHTDSLSRPTIVEASLTLSRNDRNGYQQRKTGHQGNPGDDGGHLISSIYNGPGEKINMVPMDPNLNRGAWKKMENEWGKALKEGKSVDVKITSTYTGDSQRPDKFNVRYSIDGERPVRLNFNNSPEGK